jgi:hypothetical protein
MANGLDPVDFRKVLQGTNTNKRLMTPALYTPLLLQWEEMILALGDLTISNILVMLWTICNELEQQDKIMAPTHTHTQIKNYDYSLLYKAWTRRPAGSIGSLAKAPTHEKCTIALCVAFHGHCWGDGGGIVCDIKAIWYNLHWLQPQLAILWTLANAILPHGHH